MSLEDSFDLWAVGIDISMQGCSDEMLTTFDQPEDYYHAHDNATFLQLDSTNFATRFQNIDHSACVKERTVSLDSSSHSNYADSSENVLYLHVLQNLAKTIRKSEETRRIVKYIRMSDPNLTKFRCNNHDDDDPFRIDFTRKIVHQLVETTIQTTMPKP